MNMTTKLLGLVLATTIAAPAMAQISVNTGTGTNANLGVAGANVGVNTNAVIGAPVQAPPPSPITEETRIRNQAEIDAHRGQLNAQNAASLDASPRTAAEADAVNRSAARVNSDFRVNGETTGGYSRVNGSTSVNAGVGFNN